jgi:hypothetical protein
MTDMLPRIPALARRPVPDQPDLLGSHRPNDEGRRRGFHLDSSGLDRTTREENGSEVRKPRRIGKTRHHVGKTDLRPRSSSPNARSSRCPIQRRVSRVATRIYLKE